MSKETRTIRPFIGLEGLKDVLDEVLLHFGQEACLANDGLTVDLSPREFLLRPVSVEWGSDGQAFKSFTERLVTGAQTAGLALVDLSLVVVGSSSYLKLSEVVLDHSLANLTRLTRISDLTTSIRPQAFSAPFSGFSVDAYLLLTRSLEPKPLRPYLRGTWIATSRFRVDTTLGPALLPPTPLTDEIRERLHLPGKTIRYLDFREHDLLTPYAQQEQPVFYIDEKLLAQMNARRKSAASKALQLQLAHDFVSAVVRRASANSELTVVNYQDVHTSLLGSVIRIAAGPGATEEDRERLVGKIKDHPEYVIARAEHTIDVASGYSDLLEASDK